MRDRLECVLIECDLLGVADLSGEAELPLLQLLLGQHLRGRDVRLAPRAAPSRKTRVTRTFLKLFNTVCVAQGVQGVLTATVCR